MKFVFRRKNPSINVKHSANPRNPRYISHSHSSINNNRIIHFITRLYNHDMIENASRYLSDIICKRIFKYVAFLSWLHVYKLFMKCFVCVYRRRNKKGNSVSSKVLKYVYHVFDICNISNVCAMITILFFFLYFL